MEDIVWVLVPLAALSIPLVAVAGRLVVQPIVGAIAKLTDAQQAARAGPAGGEARLTRVEERMAELETQLHRMVEEQKFQRELLSGKPGSVQERP